MFEKSNNIDVILDSLDGIKRAEAPPFLYMRIQAKLSQFRLNQPGYNFLEKLGHLISRPAIAISFLISILFIDGIVFKSVFKSASVKFENTSEEFLISDDFDEPFYYSTPESEYDYLFAQK